MHVAWPEIESFSSVRKSVEKYPELLGGNRVVEYRAKVKLHGTNAAVQVRGDKVIAQSRERFITPGDDNRGFARWVEATSEQWKLVGTRRPMIFFGEWCGPGIMHGVAVNKIPQKVFAVFAAASLPVEDDSDLIVDPPMLSYYLGGAPTGVYVLPWYDGLDRLPINMLETPEIIQPFLDKVNDSVAAVEACDPWVKETFGIEGTGEGLVFYPIGATRKRFSDLSFKAKGEKHKVVAKSAPAQVDPVVAESIEAFAEMVLTEARLEQGARAASGGELTYEKRLIGPFMAWIGKDVEKETAAELAASGLTWKQVQKAVADRARRWYLGRS